MKANSRAELRTDGLAQAYLEAALKSEYAKFRDMPPKADLVPGYQAASGWGFLVAAYFLIEESFKAVLSGYGSHVKKTHTLAELFADLPERDKTILGEYHNDFLSTFQYTSPFPYRQVESFLENLDGSDKRGSFDWRYFLIEERPSAVLPQVSVNLMHEVVFASLRILAFQRNNEWDPLQYTHSWRKRRVRDDRYFDWLLYRMNSPGWAELGDRLEILWGPDYKGRYDYMVFRGDRRSDHFAPLPDLNALDMHVEYKKDEMDSFDPRKAYSALGITTNRVARQMPKSGHVMF